MAKVANDAVARPTNAQPGGVGLGREEGLLPRLGDDDRHRAAPVCSLQFPVWSVWNRVSRQCGL